MEAPPPPTEATPTSSMATPPREETPPPSSPSPLPLVQGAEPVAPPTAEEPIPLPLSKEPAPEGGAIADTPPTDEAPPPSSPRGRSQSSSSSSPGPASSRGSSASPPPRGRGQNAEDEQPEPTPAATPKQEPAAPMDVGPPPERPPDPEAQPKHFRRKIALAKGAGPTEPEAGPAAGAGRKRRWGSVLGGAGRRSLSISTDSLKSLVPGLRAEAVLELHPPEDA
ncbi:lysine-rich arabinogalactan protein 19-like, partial [Numida meleagris]|uniref:lysine-rich arabinogalactan protein 19-like n=1 Tax=Numida meleagris TaxID=8996 RepID=UPI000B3E3787